MGFISTLTKVFKGHEPYEDSSNQNSSSLNKKMMESGLKILDIFMAQQEAPLSLYSSELRFEDELQRLRYLNFYLGAADRIATGLFKTPQEADTFFLVATFPRASQLYGSKNALLWVQAYGKNKPGTAEHEAGRAGWETVETFSEIMNTNTPQAAVNELRPIAYKLYDVVKA
ncbi:hypothetical protein LG201_07295 [Methylobacillus gramineus]|uniref:hypothetical protein n=1 Tax=Methylobacillus gramineus TaxID=755169 RepID=UPI001CFFC8E9|nr:hypothetical protein [Methylobacillus gramineus]MCB5185006.1 hypothetical protein [Methylobacillus gramineus]